MAHNEQTRDRFLEVLEEAPFISYACKKTGIARATVYRWLASNSDFKRRVDEALKQGRESLTDVAEMELVKMIRKGQFQAAKFFLEHNSKRYAPRRPIANDRHPEQAPSVAQSAFLGPDGEVLVRPKTRALLDQEAKERQERKQRALGWDTPPE